MMSIDFSKHAMTRLMQRFAEPDVIRALVNLVEHKLDANPFPRAAGTKEVINGTILFRRVRVVAIAMGSRSFRIVSVMWTDNR